MSVSELTKLELEVLGLRAQRYDNDYIARHVNPRPKSVEGILIDILGKLELPRTPQRDEVIAKAVAIVRRAGLFTWQSAKEPSRKLTSRELEVGQGVVDGLTNKEISDKLHIKPDSVKQFISSMQGKLYLATSREQLADALLQRGFVK